MFNFETCLMFGNSLRQTLLSHSAGSKSPPPKRIRGLSWQ